MMLNTLVALEALEKALGFPRTSTMFEVSHEERLRTAIEAAHEYHEDRDQRVRVAAALARLERTK